MRVLITFLCAFLLFYSGDSQTNEEKWNLGIHAGVHQYHGDLGNGWYNRYQAIYGLGGLSISRYLNERFDFSFFGTYGEIGFLGPYTVLNENVVDNNFRLRIATGNFLVRRHLRSRDVMADPYIFAGLSVMKQRDLGSRPVKLNAVDFGLPVAGAGLNLRFGDYTSVQLQETFTYLWTDASDHTAQGINDMYLMHSIGITTNIWRKSRKGFGSRAGGRINRCDADLCDRRMFTGHSKGVNVKTKAKLRKPD